MQHADFGEITFVRNAKIRRLSARIFPNGLNVRLPLLCSENEALKWLEKEKIKILKKQQNAQKQKKNNILITPENPLKTLTFNIIAIPTNRENVYFSMKNDILTIEFPENQDCTDEKMQKIFWNGINHFLRREAKRILPPRVKQLADNYHFTYSKVIVKQIKSRWGSCSNKGNINLSFYLMLLPPYLIDYVILHELCHTREMNHSDRFWRQMDAVTGAAGKKLRQELKQYNMP